MATGAPSSCQPQALHRGEPVHGPDFDFLERKRRQRGIAGPDLARVDLASPQPDVASADFGNVAGRLGGLSSGEVIGIPGLFPQLAYF